MNQAAIDRAIRSTRVVTPGGECPAAVLVSGGKIVDVAAYDDVPADVPLDDWGSLAILPGLVDTHVHCNEPGHTDWEGFETATKSAIAGGVTTIVDMPLNSLPVTTNADAFRQKIAATVGKLWCDVGFWGGVVPGNAAEMQELIDAGVLGFKAFLCDSGLEQFPSSSAEDLQTAMEILAAAKLPLLAHCEVVLADASIEGDPRSYQTWLKSRPPKYEADAILLMIELCKATHCHVHIVHLANALCQEYLLDLAVQSLPITVETCPHYLCFAAEEIPDGATEFKCAPPIRESWNCDQLWKMLQCGIIKMIVSDHSPCPPEMKSKTGNFLESWGGIASLQLGLPAVWNASRDRSVLLQSVASWMSGQPASLAGLQKRKGAIAGGKDADLVVFDTETCWTVDPQSLYHRHKITPYAGRRLQGRVAATYLHGEKVFEAGRVIGLHPHGQTLLRGVST